ncbi:hypothetical protein [Psychrobacter jeotgali]|uniref:hypothetical protein n=1 Tax=Psychrobacter jeotgali TaxID=179010 RepID=UPI00191B85C5|nr:hypothetical protein [Psychrobacter jeotgali]
MSQSEQTTFSAPTFSITNLDLPSLHLLHDEIMATLKDTEAHLRRFNDDHTQSLLLLDSIEVLQQLSAIFEVIALKGGKILSSAIAQGLQQLYNSADNNDAALIMDLSEAIMILDRYVEFVLLTEMVEPTLLLPIINKLREHSEQENIAADYFTNFDSSSISIANPEHNFQPLTELSVDRDLLTQAYRSGLVVALTNKGGSVNAEEQRKLAAMSAACALIAAHSNRLFWQAASAALTDIASALPLSSKQKHTLIYLEQQFCSYLPVMDTRFADLVSFACQRDNQQAQVLREQYKLNQLESSQYKQSKRFLMGPNREVADTLKDLIQQQINTIKDNVDSYARGDLINTATMQAAQIAADLISLSSAFKLLCLNDAAVLLKEAAHAVAQWQTPTSDDFDHLLLALVGAENATIKMAEMHTPGAINLPLHNQNISLHQLNSAYDILIQESRTAIASAEQAINDYLVDDSREPLNLENIPTMMRQVAGAMHFLHLPLPASLFNQLATNVEQRLANDRGIADDMLAHIADTMMAVDYQLNGFESNHPVNKRSLEIGQRGLNRLLAA